MKRKLYKLLSVFVVSVPLAFGLPAGMSFGQSSGQPAIQAFIPFPGIASMESRASEELEIGPGVMPWLAREITDSPEELERAARYIEIKPENFKLPDGARVLVAVEGTRGSNCTVYVWERTEQAQEKAGQETPERTQENAEQSQKTPEQTWELRLITLGCLGENGMSNHRESGDRTTPIGVFQLNTPFGQADPLEGFPSDYVKVTESYVWVDETNRLAAESDKSGERVGTAAYARIYDYVLDAGYNKNAVEKKGSALFLHCTEEGKTSSAGCVAIPEDSMIRIMRLYGTYGNGACYIAQAPRGTFDQIYDTYGANNGLSPEGDFKR